MKGELPNLRANPASAEREQTAATSLIAERVEALLGIVNEISLAQIEINCKSMSADNDAEQTSARVATVADATKELHVSILEIANQINRNGQVVSEATFKAKGADVILQTMLVAVDRICEILSAIKAVALRLDLLALNATIEAACLFRPSSIYMSDCRLWRAVSVLGAFLERRCAALFYFSSPLSYSNRRRRRGRRSWSHRMSHASGRCPNFQARPME